MQTIPSSVVSALFSSFIFRADASCNIDDVIAVFTNRPNLPEVTTDDIAKSIDKLKELGRGFQTHAFGDSMMVQSVPTEFNKDHSAILGLAAGAHGKVTAPALCLSMGWSDERAVTLLEQLVKDGMAWVDDQGADGVREYWLPGLIAESAR